ncbi:hypothetical protein BB170200_05422 [Mycobacterium marinum]|nr:hypothetical protein BB170200_05422 [Mycobacterium marinum]
MGTHNVTKLFLVPCGLDLSQLSLGFMRFLQQDFPYGPAELICSVHQLGP